MIREFRLRETCTGWIAEMRFDAPDEELWAIGILPGWHVFKRSKTRDVAEKVAKQAFDQADEAAWRPFVKGGSS